MKLLLGHREENFKGPLQRRTYYNQFLATSSDTKYTVYQTYWFTDEYNRHFKETDTYRQVENFNFNATVTNSNVDNNKVCIKCVQPIKETETLL